MSTVNTLKSILCLRLYLALYFNQMHHTSPSSTLAQNITCLTAL
ncbi:hypothetical protein GLYMA_02G000850v4 [Glycine max]|nr:hypothetical protein GLYMA_02G000850v4 [Glycine max]KAH1058041.1 hypothetical protein GYH30_002555 [Glycine max]